MPDESALDCLLVHAAKLQTYYRPLNVYQSCNRMTMGLFALADSADKKGYRTRILHSGIEHALDRKFSFTDYLKIHRPRVIGFSLHFHHAIVDTFLLAKEARKAVPDAFIFLGGFTATFFAKDILASVPEIDAVVKGDAEEPLLAVLETVVKQGDRDLAAVPNLVWRREGEAVENEQSYSTTADTLNEMCFTRLDLLEHSEMYVSMSKAFIKTNLPQKLTLLFNRIVGADRSGIYWGLPVGRGCVYNCFYCGGGARAQRDLNRRRGVIFRKPEKVIETIRELMALGFTGCYVSFDPHPMSQEYYIKLFRMMREQGIVFSILFSSWRLATHEFLDEFAKLLGPKSAYLVSPETGSEELRRLAKGSTGFSNEELFENLEYADKLGIKTSVYFSIGALDRRPEDFEKTRTLEREIKERIRNASVEAFVIEAEPGAPWQMEPERYGINLQRKNLADFVRDHSSATYSSMTSLGYTTGFFGDPNIDPDVFSRKLLKLQCRYFCNRRLLCWAMSKFWAVCRFLRVVPRPKQRKLA